MSRREGIAAVCLALMAAWCVEASVPRPPREETVDDSPLFARRLEVGIGHLDAPEGRIQLAALPRVQIVESPLSLNPVSFCVGSACLGSICAGSACLLSNCAGSACGNSKCIGSGCAVSLCAGSACGTSACVGSVCLGSFCVGSACTQCGLETPAGKGSEG
jgi:hypothetical protein